MTQVAKPEAILAPFVGETPGLEGTKWRLEQADGESLVTALSEETGRPTGPRQRIVLTTGSHHYQIYWLEDRAKGMAQLPLVWHLGQKEWVPRKAMFLVPPMHGSGDETGRWRKTCIKCHATNGTSRAADDGQTRVAEFGISCEACHGPGAEHTALHRDKEKSASLSASLEGGAADPTIVHPGRLPHDRASEICGQCHGIHPLPSTERDAWQQHGFEYRPGDVLADTRHLLRGTYEANSEKMRAFLDRNPDTLEGLFWGDGEVRVSGRELNGLADSPCYQRGEMSCLSCHRLHKSSSDPRSNAEWSTDQLAFGMEGFGACIECHTEYRSKEKVRQHTHHATESTGSACMNCHMPYTSYGLTKLIRSHTITIPDATRSFEARKPLACNLCHLDKSLGWSADHLTRWFEHDRPQLPQTEEETSAVVLWALRGDAGLRAVAAWILGWEPARAVSGTGWMAYLFSTLLMDSYDAVRWVALQSQRKDPRYMALRLDFTASIEEQRNVIRETVLTQWLKKGLQADEAQRSAVLVKPDGSLDNPRFRKIYAERDRKPVSLHE